ncbi:paraquat-inducible protein A [Pararobbsia alpina]|nr:paraquat-inducible protein A [Pararobbsia alpina]
MELDKYVACEICDTVHHKQHLAGLATARCTRCGSTLYRSVGLRSADRQLAIAFGAFITFLIANAFPIVELETNGLTTRTTLIEAILNLVNGDRTLIAVIVALATIVFPLMEILALIYLLLPMRLGRRSPGFDLVLRGIQAVRPWGMIEVFMLGVLITVVKMTSIARVIPEIALFAFGVLSFLIAALVSYNPRDLWNLADETLVRITSMRLRAAANGKSMHASARAAGPASVRAVIASGVPAGPSEGASSSASGTTESPSPPPPPTSRHP